MMNRKQNISIFVGAIIAMLMGCMLAIYGSGCHNLRQTDFLKTGYNTLDAAQVTANAAAVMIADLYEAHKITDDQLEKAELSFHAFRSAHTVAVHALYAYKISCAQDDKEKAITALTALSLSLIEVQKLLAEVPE